MRNYRGSMQIQGVLDRLDMYLNMEGAEPAART